MLGGLLSAHALTHDRLYLDKALQLALGLRAAFDTPSGVRQRHTNPGAASCSLPGGTALPALRRAGSTPGHPPDLDVHRTWTSTGHARFVAVTSQVPHPDVNLACRTSHGPKQGADQSITAEVTTRRLEGFEGYITVTPPLHHRYITVTSPLHHRAIRGIRGLPTVYIPLPTVAYHRLLLLPTTIAYRWLPLLTAAYRNMAVTRPLQVTTLQLEWKLLAMLTGRGDLFALVEQVDRYMPVTCDRYACSARRAG